MGCTQSSNANPTEDDPSRVVPIHHDGPTNTTTSSSTADTRGRLARGASGVERLNQRIRPISPISKSPRNVSQVQPPWTRGHLTRQREIFFETRVSGRPEVWSAINLACDVLVHGQMLEAQGILDAANITCPTGHVAKGRGHDRVRGGLYDDRGRLYDVPAWVMRDPDDLVEDEEKDEVELDEDHAAADALAQQRREEKGKGRAEDVGEEIRVRVRFSNGDDDVQVTIGSKQTVAVLMRLLKDRLKQGPGLRIRLVYLGRILELGKTLEGQGWKVGDTLSALVQSPLDA